MLPQGKGRGPRACHSGCWRSALRAAVLHDADGRTLRTLGDLVDSLAPLDAAAERQPQPPALPADLALADAVGSLLSGPHAAGDVARRRRRRRHARLYFARDVFARLAAALAHSTLYDPLTGLPTRRWVLDEVDRRLAGASPAAPLGLLQVELGPAQGHQRQPRVRAGRRADRRGRPPAGRGDRPARRGRPAGRRRVRDRARRAARRRPDRRRGRGGPAGARRCSAGAVRLGEHELQLQASVGRLRGGRPGGQRRARAAPGGQRDAPRQGLRPRPGRALRPGRGPSGRPALDDAAAARGARGRTPSRCTGSRSTGSATARWSAPRRWSAGRTSPAGWCRRTSSSRTRRPSG